jgi:tetratricopeptide (TPR) repeat protein
VTVARIAPLAIVLAGCLDIDAPPPVSPVQQAEIDRRRAAAEAGEGSWADLGDAYAEAGRWLDAADAYRAALGRGPTASSQGKLAQAYLELGYESATVRELRGCMETAPEEPECLLPFGRLLELDGSPGALRQARAVYGQFLEAAPDHPAAARARSVLAQLGGALPEAPPPPPPPSTPPSEGNKPKLNPFGQALARALDAARAGRPAESAAAFREALVIDPGNPNARAGLAEAQWTLGEAEAALNTLNEALARGPEDPQVLFVAGILYLRERRPAEAEAAWTKLKQLHPELAEQLGISERLASLRRSTDGTVQAPAKTNDGSGRTP